MKIRRFNEINTYDEIKEYDKILINDITNIARDEEYKTSVVYYQPWMSKTNTQDVDILVKYHPLCKRGDFYDFYFGPNEFNRDVCPHDNGTSKSWNEKSNFRKICIEIYDRLKNYRL